MIDPEEEAIMQLYMNPQGNGRKTIADVIREKMREKEMESEFPQAMESRLDPKIIEVYTQYGVWFGFDVLG